MPGQAGRSIASIEQEAASTLGLPPETVPRCLVSLTRALDHSQEKI